MADTILTADIIAKTALPILDNELAVLSTLHRGLESEYSKNVNGYSPGETISIRRPADFTVTTGATRSDQDVVEGKVALTVDTQKHISFSFSSADLTLKVEDMAERTIKPAMVNLANDVANDVFTNFYKGIYNWAGTPGETINSFADFIKGPERMDEMAIPQDSRNALLSPADYWALIGSNSGIFVQEAAAKALRKGNLGLLGNVSTWMSQVTPTHTVGAHGGTPVIDGASQNVTYDTAKNTWSQTLTTDGWGTSDDLFEGDVFTIAGVFMVNPKTKASTGILQQFVLTADVTTNASAAADTVLTISPPIISAGQHQTVSAAPADGAAIVYSGTAGAAYKQNLAYHKNAMALAVVPMEIPGGAKDAGRATRNGLSVRVVQDYDIDADNNVWRLDILYGKKLIDPRLATRLSGTA